MPCDLDPIEPSHPTDGLTTVAVDYLVQLADLCEVVKTTIVAKRPLSLAEQQTLYFRLSQIHLQLCEVQAMLIHRGKDGEAACIGPDDGPPPSRGDE